jgi:hypothetical protein
MYIQGFRCETCSEERVFGRPQDSSPENLYLYIDLSGATRCFCKNHMYYTNNNGELLKFGDSRISAVCYGAELISNVLSQ